MRWKQYIINLVKITSLTCSVLLMGCGELKKPHYRSHASYGVSSDSQALTKNWDFFSWLFFIGSCMTMSCSTYLLWNFSFCQFIYANYVDYVYFDKKKILYIDIVYSETIIPNEPNWIWIVFGWYTFKLVSNNPVLHSMWLALLKWKLL
jgi:hypothetical protein